MPPGLFFKNLSCLSLVESLGTSRGQEGVFVIEDNLTLWLIYTLVDFHCIFVVVFARKWCDLKTPVTMA
jgi:hypothetical protein